MSDFNFSDACTDVANKNYLCDHCRRGQKCKDYTGIYSNKKYHHIYCQRYEEVVSK